MDGRHTKNIVTVNKEVIRELKIVVYNILNRIVVYLFRKARIKVNKRKAIKFRVNISSWSGNSILTNYPLISQYTNIGKLTMAIARVR
jgi:hypothetical protein